MLVFLAALAAVTLAAPATHAQEVLAIHPAQTPGDLKLDEILSIGSLAGEHDAFGRVTDVALDGRGRILVADDFGRHYKVFDPSGSYLATVGRRGEGPGEFEGPWSIAVGTEDSVFVWDYQRARISVFSGEHGWGRDVRLPPAWMVNTMIPRPDGTLVLAAFGRDDRFPVKVLGPDGTILSKGGMPIEAPNLYGFEDSLLGGFLAPNRLGVRPYDEESLRTDVPGRGACSGPRLPRTARTYDGSEGCVGCDGAWRRHSMGRVPTLRVHSSPR